MTFDNINKWQDQIQKTLKQNQELWMKAMKTTEEFIADEVAFTKQVIGSKPEEVANLVAKNFQEKQKKVMNKCQEIQADVLKFKPESIHLNEDFHKKTVEAMEQGFSAVKAGLEMSHKTAKQWMNEIKK